MSAASALLVTIAAVGLRVPTPPPAAVRRRGILLTGGGVIVAATTFTALPPANAELIFDPIGAYGMGAGAGSYVGQVKKNAEGKPNGGILLLRETFDGTLPPEGLVNWYNEALADDFKATFAGSDLVLDKASYVAATAELLKSFPDLAYTRVTPMKFADSPLLITWTAIVTGTHTGAPYSPSPSLQAVKPQTPPKRVENDPEKITATFASKSGLTQIKAFRVEPLPGGRGFSGPMGFYLQAGGGAEGRGAAGGARGS
jgi:hypothetical protein